MNKTKNLLIKSLIMLSLILIPLFVKSNNDNGIDASKFVEYFNKFGNGQTIESIWPQFIKSDPSVKSSITEVSSLLHKDGKAYYYDQDFKVQDFTNADINNFSVSNYLTDMGNFIDDSKEPEINNFIYDYQKQTGVEICIITVTSLEDQVIEDYAQKQFNRLGVGKASSNNGIMIVVSMNDRKWRIHTGYGVEGLLPDITCSRIGMDIITENFKNKDYFGGLMSALVEIKSIIDKNPDDIKKFQAQEQARVSKEITESLTTLGEVLLAIVLILIVFVVLYRVYRKRKKMLMEIESKLTKIESIKRSIVKSGQVDVDNLYNGFQTLLSSKAQSISNISKNEKGLNDLELISNEIFKSYNTWLVEYTKLQHVLQTITKHNKFKILKSIDNGLDACNKLQMNYKITHALDADKLKSEAFKLNEMISRVGTVCPNSLYDAMSILSEYDKVHDKIMNTLAVVNNQLAKYNAAKNKVDNWKQMVDSSIADMNRYDDWAEGNELEQVLNKVKAFALTITNTELIKLASNVDILLSDIYAMRRKWSDRQDEAERKKRRAAAAVAAAALAAEESSRSSSNSYSSSSSTSSFSDFGGGSSGGGGASGSW